MKSTVLRLLLLAGLLAPAAAALAEPALRVVTSHLPPLAVEGRPAAPGALVEVVAELTRRAGIPARTDFVPWRRAVFMSTHFPQTAIFPLTRSAEREDHYRWLVRLYHEQFVFFAPDGVALADVAALRGRRVAILRGSAQIPWLRSQGYRRLVETASVEEGLRFLQSGMADVLFGDLDITRAAAAALRPAPAPVLHASAPLHTTTTWLGGSRDLPATLAPRLEQALAGMLADGSYARIMRRYGLGPNP